MSSDGVQYLDTVEYWKEANERSHKRSQEVENELRATQEVEHELRARVLELEVLLEAGNDTTGRTTQRAVVTTGKRKRGRPKAADNSQGRATKLAKTANTTIVARESAINPTLLDIDLDLVEDALGD